MGSKAKIKMTITRIKGLLHVLRQSLIIAGLLCIASALPAAASYIPFNTSVNMNVGIGTATPQGAFVVTNGNVGIGTWSPGGLLDVEGTLSKVILGGNVGIGSNNPGYLLDVTGNSASDSGIRATNLNNSSSA